jgi:hypothetical protein
LLLLLLSQTASKFTVNFVTVVPFFKVTEEVPLNGGSVQQRRRDLRQGRQTAAARTVSSPEQQGVLVEMSWGAPLQGEEDCIQCIHVFPLRCTDSSGVQSAYFTWLTACSKIIEDKYCFGLASDAQCAKSMCTAPVATAAAGTLTELYSLLPDGCLAVTAETHVGAISMHALLLMAFAKLGVLPCFKRHHVPRHCCNCCCRHAHRVVLTAA